MALEVVDFQRFFCFMDIWMYGFIDNIVAFCNFYV